MVYEKRIIGLWLISDFLPSLYVVIIKESSARQKRRFVNVSDKHCHHVTVLDHQ